MQRGGLWDAGAGSPSLWKAAGMAGVEPAGKWRGVVWLVSLKQVMFWAQWPYDTG